MRRAIWPAATLGLMIACFPVGRMTGGFHNLPAIAATLPGDEAEFSFELDARIRERFPIGTSEDKLIAAPSKVDACCSADAVAKDEGSQGRGCGVAA